MAMIRTELIQIRCSPQEKAAISQAASRLGLTAAEYVRMLALGASVAIHSENQRERDLNWNGTGKLVFSLLGEDMNIQGADM